MADGHTHLATSDRPAFSALSDPPFPGRYVFGADWPEWQRNLHPVTYSTIADRDRVLARLEAQRREVAWARTCLHRMLKQGDRKAAARYRAQLDRHLTYVRNCETQLRLIDAAAAYLAASAERRAA
jgi:hypothetical protein